MGTTVGFTGTRKGMTEAQKRTVENIFKVVRIDALHIGDCLGADEQAHMLAKKRGILVKGGVLIIVHPPIDDKHRAYLTGYDSIKEPKPYLVRNHAIVRICEVLVATPSQKREIVRSGTWATIRYGIKENKPVLVVLPCGRVERRGDVETIILMKGFERRIK